MKCSRCGLKAVIYLRYARLALCHLHLEEYLAKRVVDAVKHGAPIGKDQLIVVAVSGGKDSAAAASLLSLVKDQLRFKLASVHIDLGIPGYSEENRKTALLLAEKLSLPLAVLDLKEVLGFNVVEAARRAKRPICSVCGLLKRYLLNLSASLTGATRLATGHNLDDLAAYAVKGFLTHEETPISKLIGHTGTVDGLIGRLRPLIEVGEYEALVYALSSKLPFNHEECPYVNRRGLEFRAKEFLALLEEERPGFKLAFLRGLLKKKVEVKAEGELRKCSMCGMPTSSEVCAFCRLIYRVKGSYDTVEKVHKYVEEKTRELRSLI